MAAYAVFRCEDNDRGDGMSKPWQNPTRTSGRPEAGRWLVRISAVFTMVPESKIADVGR